MIRSFVFLPLLLWLFVSSCVSSVNTTTTDNTETYYRATIVSNPQTISTDLIRAVCPEKVLEIVPIPAYAYEFYSTDFFLIEVQFHFLTGDMVDQLQRRIKQLPGVMRVSVGRM